MKKNLPLYLSIAGVLALCLVLVGYVLYMNFSNPENNEGSDDDSYSTISRDEAIQTLDGFVTALKVYDIKGMTPYLSVFPDKSRDGTIDDMYSDETYQQIYRKTFSSITYELVGYSDNCATIKATLPNIKSLYQNASMKLNFGAMNNADLKDKLMENDMNAIILFQQLMLYEVVENNNVKHMTKEYVLTLDRSGDKVKIIADDQLCAFMTGDFSLTRNLPSDMVE